MREDLILEHKDIGIEINRHFSISATILCNEQTWEKEIVKGLSQLVSKSITMNHGLELKLVSHFWNRVSSVYEVLERFAEKFVCDIDVSHELAKIWILLFKYFGGWNIIVTFELLYYVTFLTHLYYGKRSTHLESRQLILHAYQLIGFYMSGNLAPYGFA